jgi:beta-glucanase (GH16 family)
MARARTRRSFALPFILLFILVIGSGASSALLGCAASPPSADAAATSPPSADAASAVLTGAFQLSWEDNFDAFDTSRWQLMTHTWDGNLAQFSTANTSFKDGILSLMLTAEASDTLKPFRGVEMRSRDTLTYGKIETRARMAKGSGVISAAVLIYTPWPADDWNELDIEFLGQYQDRIQFNTQVYLGDPVPKPATVSVTPTQSPQVVTLGFDPSVDFHVYGIEWTPKEVRYTIDGVVMNTWDTSISRMKLPQNILLTIWASSAAGWAGPILPDTAPTTADFDWIKVYSWVPDRS